MKENQKFVRPKAGLPLTFLIVGETKTIGGDAYLVKEYGYSKEFAMLKDLVEPMELSPLMHEQISHWLSMIGGAQ